MDFEWSDLRYFLAVARHGTTLAAARDLGVNQTTCARRIAALETALDAALFERSAKGYTLTPLGQALVDHASTVAAGAEAFRQVATGTRGDGRHIRVTTSDWMAEQFVQPALGDFARLRPDIRVTLDVSHRRANLRSGEADVALRGGYELDDPSLVGMKIGETPWAFYCAADFRDPPRSTPAALGHALALPEGDAEAILRGMQPSVTVGYTSNSTAALVDAIATGGFVGPLPRLVGDSRTELLFCCGVAYAAPSVWIVFAERLRHVRHVRAFVNHLARHVRTRRVLERAHGG